MKRFVLAAGLALFVPQFAQAQGAAAATPTATVATDPAAPPAQSGVQPDGAAKPPLPKPTAPDALPPPDVRWRVLLGGLGVFGVSYGGMALMGGLWDGLPGADYLFIPVAGPWIALGESGCAPGEETVEGDGDCDAMMGLRGVIYVVDGLLQLGGLGLIGQSIFMDTADPANTATVMPVPFMERDALGLGVVGTF